MWKEVTDNVVTKFKCTKFKHLQILLNVLGHNKQKNTLNFVNLISTKHFILLWSYKQAKQQKSTVVIKKKTLPTILCTY